MRGAPAKPVESRDRRPAAMALLVTGLSFDSHRASVSPRHAHYRHTKRKIHPLQPPTLSAEDAPQHTIQHRNIDVALRRGAQTGQAHEDPTEERWHEERYVCITRALDIEARALDRLSQLGQ